jgi:hypothetical protein
VSVPKKFRGYAFTVEDWLAVCEMHGNKCAKCGEEKPLCVDHIKPRVAGGTDELSNIQPLCKSCNSIKSATHEGVNLKKNRVVDRIARVDFRFSDEDMAYLSLLMKKTGLTKTGVVVQALRDFARSKRITADDAEAIVNAKQATETGDGEG